MPRDGSNVYHRPSGIDAVTNTTISSTAYNLNVQDVETDLNTPRPIVAGGTGATSADGALDALSAEKFKQIVTNWDATTWRAGSYYAATTATGSAPVAGHAFAGVAYYANATDFVNEATDLTDPAKTQYIRTQSGGVWGAWSTLTGVSFTSAQSLTSAQQVQARQNIYAAPFDAMEFNGMQINGSMGISQENGLNVVTFLNGTTKYIVDGFFGYKVNGATITGQQSLGAQIGGGYYRAVMFVNAATAVTSIAAADSVSVLQYIEGMRVAKLGWGNSIAQPITIAFWTSSTVAGHASLSVKNGGSNRSYVVDYTLAGGNVWEYKVITIPGDVTGTWTRDNNVGLQISWTYVCGSTYQTAANVWTAGNFLATPAQTNLLGTLGNQVWMTGVTILPGIEAPSAAQSFSIERPADYELILCSRYLQTINVGGSYVPCCGLTNSATVMIPMLANMRAVPTVYLPWGDANYNSAVSATTWAFSTPGVANMTKTGTLTCTGFAQQPGLASAIFYGATISGNSTAINNGANIVPIKLDARL